MYAKNIQLLPEIFVPFLEEKSDRFYKYKDENFHIRGCYRTHPLEAVQSVDARENLRFGVQAPDGTIVYPKRQWRWGKEHFDEALSKNEVIFNKSNNGDWTLYSKQYINDENGTRRKTKAQSLIDDVFTQDGSKEIFEIFRDTKIFLFPKPIRFIYRLLEIGMLEYDDIILDFFSGSATTAHAVMQLNAEDGGNRKFIMVQLPEVCDKDSEATKAGYKNICEIGKERIRRAGRKIIEESPLDRADLDIGFRVLKLDSSNMKDVYYTPQETVSVAGALEVDLDGFVDNIKPDRTPEDLLFQVMLDLGIMLSSKIEKRGTGGKTVFSVADNYLLACFDLVTDEIVTEIAKSKPYYAVFRDSSFYNDATLVNFEQIFKTHSPSTIRKVL